MDIFKFEIIALRRVARGGPLLLRGVQYRLHLAEDGAHGADVVGVAHQRDERGYQTN